MAEFHVLPDGNGWKVTNGIMTTSRHRKKDRAKAEAKIQASPGDTIYYHGSGGRVQNVVEVR